MHITQGELIAIYRQPLPLRLLIDPYLAVGLGRRLGGSVGEDADVVQTVEVVRMAMGQQQSIQPIYARFQSLATEVRPHVN